MSLTKVILVNASSDSNSQDSIGGYLNWCLQSQFEIFFSSIHHFCLKCQGMLDTSTIIVCSVLYQEKKQGHFVKKMKILLHLYTWVWRYHSTHPSVFNSHTAPYVHHKILMWGNNAGSVQTSQGSYYSSASTQYCVVYKAYFLLSTIGQYECHQLPF